MHSYRIQFKSLNSHRIQMTVHLFSPLGPKNRHAFQKPVAVGHTVSHSLISIANCIDYRTVPSYKSINIIKIKYGFQVFMRFSWANTMAIPKFWAIKMDKCVCALCRIFIIHKLATSIDHRSDDKPHGT